VKKNKGEKLRFGKAFVDTTTDILKSGIKFLLGVIWKIVWNIYGVTILAILTIALLGLRKWLNTPVNLPIYFIGLLLAASVIFVLALQILVRNIGQRRQTIKYAGFSWRIKYGENISILGPACPSCRKAILHTESGVETQLNNAAIAIFGRKPVYTFKCSCGYLSYSEKSLSELFHELRFMLENPESVEGS